MVATTVVLNLREVEVFRPYDAEFPEPLLIEHGVNDDTLTAWHACDIVRIAKIDHQTVGAYALHRPVNQDKNQEQHRAQMSFHLLGVLIAESHRRQGLGRWLVGHAIGVAESKGGRHLWTDAGRQARFFSRIGFVEDDAYMRFDMIPE